MAGILSDLGELENGARPIRRRNAGPTREDLEMIERTRAARDLLASKWKVDPLYLLARGAQRYSRLYDNLRGASKKMLTDSLRGLERDGFVERSVYAQDPGSRRILADDPRLGGNRAPDDARRMGG